MFMYSMPGLLCHKRSVINVTDLINSLITCNVIFLYQHYECDKNMWIIESKLVDNRLAVKYRKNKRTFSAYCG